MTKKLEADDSSGEEVPFSKAQIDHLSKLLLSSMMLPTSLSHVAKSGPALSSFTYPNEEGEPWIIDFGAFNHMPENL